MLLGFFGISDSMFVAAGRSCSVDDDRENIDRLHASSEQHKRQLRSNQLDVRKSEQKIKDLTINIRYLHIKPYATRIKYLFRLHNIVFFLWHVAQ